MEGEGGGAGRGGGGGGGGEGFKKASDVYIAVLLLLGW
jgi:hypothetical protein